MAETSPARLLLIEDEPGLVMTLSDRLSAEGFEVQAATDGETGLTRAATEPFEIIVLDGMLPRRDGFDVCRTLRQRGIPTPILMLTARGQVVDRVVGLKLGADDYLTKPFEMAELLARLEALLRSATFTSTFGRRRSRARARRSSCRRASSSCSAISSSTAARRSHATSC
jgi:DNA-binding response OmpR family regulator